MSPQEIAEHRVGMELIKALGLKKVSPSSNLVATSWGYITPIRLVKSLQLALKSVEPQKQVVR